MKKPPHFANRFLHWYCDPEWIEEIEGDLQTLFLRRVEKYGYKRAQLLYWLNVLMFLHPNFIRRKKFYPQNTTAMFRNYFTIAFRNITKHTSFTVINMAGLTLGITAALIILLIVRFELSFDNFHAQGDRIYRVIKGDWNSEECDTGTPHGLMPVLEKEFPEIEKVAVAYKPNPNETQLEINHELMRNSNIYFTTASFFEMFDFQWIVGSPQKSLGEPGQVVIDEELARQLFDGDAMGKSIRLNNEYDLTVSGIIEKIPGNSDFPIQIAVSHATFAASDNYQKELNTGTGSFYHTYLLLHEHANPATLEAKIRPVIVKYLGEEGADVLKLSIQPLHNIHFNPNTQYGNFTKRAISKETIWSIALIGLLILITACINFVNLATAQAVTRSKEVGIRKVMGSTRMQLVWQFLSETFILCFIATLISLFLSTLFISRLGSFLSISINESMVFQREVLMTLLIICGLTSLCSGFYPAILLSKYKPVTSLKKSFTNRGVAGIQLRRGLVIFQFAVTFLLITGTIVVVSQLHYFQTTSLGYDQHAVITVDIPPHTPEQLSTFKNQLQQYATIRNVSFSLNTPSATINKWWAGYSHHSDVDEPRYMEIKAMDENYLELFDINLLAGRNIDPNDSSVEVIINETFMHVIGIQEPELALGETISFWAGQNLPIVGVVKDFNSISLHNEIHPVLLWKGYNDMMMKASFKIEMSQAHAAIEQIDEAYSQIFSEYYFTYAFLDDELATFYTQEVKTSRLLSVFSFIAIIIGCLGLYGLVSFMTTQKVKEIGIRKVLGASVQHIVFLFTKDYLILLGIAFLIAAPIGYYLMQLWLQDFTYKIELSWWIFIVTALAGLLMAGATVSFKSIRAALANPVDALRNE